MHHLYIVANTLFQLTLLSTLFIIYWESYTRDPDTFYDRLQFHRMFVLPITTKKQVCGIPALALVYITSHSELSRNSERALHDYAQHLTKSQVYITKGNGHISDESNLQTKQIKCSEFKTFHLCTSFLISLKQLSIKKLG